MDESMNPAAAVAALADITAMRRERFAVTAAVFSRETPAEAVRHMVAEAAGAAGVPDASPEDRLGRALAALSCDDMESLATATRTEYARLFLGPREVMAPLHESAYLSGVSRMFTADTLAVRRFYEGHGYIMKAKNREPEDAIGTELEFLRNLCDGLLVALGSEASREVADGALAAGIESVESAVVDPAAVVALLRTQSAFAEQHLNRWAHRFCARVREHDRSGFYAAWARYLDEVLDEDAVLEEESERLAAMLTA